MTYAADRIPVTTRPPRTPDGNKYTCGWCGIERSQGRGKRQRRNVCADCQPLEKAFGGKR